MAEDVAQHFKDLIKMQDRELRELREEAESYYITSFIYIIYNI